MTFTPERISEIERLMDEEHRKDREAFERLKRFIDPAAKGTPLVTSISRMDSEDSSDVNDTPTIIGRVETVFSEDPNRKWTIPAMVAHLKHEGFAFVAQKPEATMGQVFVKLKKRGVIKMVRRGSGRTPNVFKADFQPKEGTPGDGSKSERATQGQPVAVQ